MTRSAKTNDYTLFYSIRTFCIQKKSCIQLLQSADALRPRHTHVLAVADQAVNMHRLKVASELLLSLYSLEQSLEVAGAEAIVVPSLNDFEKECRAVLQGLHEHLQKISLHTKGLHGLSSMLSNRT